MTAHDIIWIDPDRVGGEPCFRGTRVPVRFLLDYLRAGETVEEFKKQYPWVPADLVDAFLEVSFESLAAAAR